MDAIKILDIIDHRNKYETQRMLVVDRMPQFVFERRGSGLLIGHDSGFFQFYRHETPWPNSRAFAGREFEIPMVDGTAIKANGQWWDCLPRDYAELTYDLGVNTIEWLSKCYVFWGCFHEDRDLVDSWLTENQPSNNYNKYNPKHADYGKQTIASRWDEPVSSRI